MHGLSEIQRRNEPVVVSEYGRFEAWLGREAYLKGLMEWETDGATAWGWARHAISVLRASPAKTAWHWVRAEMERRGFPAALAKDFANQVRARWDRVKAET